MKKKNPKLYSPSFPPFFSLLHHCRRRQPKKTSAHFFSSFPSSPHIYNPRPQTSIGNAAAPFLSSLTISLSAASAPPRTTAHLSSSCCRRLTACLCPTPRVSNREIACVQQQYKTQLLHYCIWSLGRNTRDQDQ
ncbi:unnamed protein product [Citrullus colocynthis]|uniref:Uncharacterized protein n=1 Tax=Citrullus colocynthis TaxID=252529 RepID=A0ABP0XN87_9ROSI